MSVDKLFDQLDKLALSKRVDITQTEDIIKFFIEEEVKKSANIE